MAYECQNCYSKFEEGEISENSLGDLQCPECGSFEVEPLDDSGFEDSDFDDSGNNQYDDEDPLYGKEGTVDED